MTEESQVWEACVGIVHISLSLAKLQMSTSQLATIMVWASVTWALPGSWQSMLKPLESSRRWSQDKM